MLRVKSSSQNDMEVDRMTLLLQGALIGQKEQPSSDEQFVRIVSKGYGSVEKCLFQKEISGKQRATLQRKLFLSHLINSPFVIDRKEVLDVELNWQPFSGMYNLPHSVLFKIVDQRGAWRFMIEALLLSHHEVSRGIVEYILNNSGTVLSKKTKHPLLRFAVAIAIVFTLRTRSQFSKQETLSISSFAKKLMEDINNEIKLNKGLNLCLNLFLLRSLLVADPAEFATTTFLLTDQDLNDFYASPGLENKSSYDLIELKVYVMKHLHSIIESVSINDWMELAEKPSKSVVHNGYAYLWFEKSDEPSKLQYLIAHLAHECLEYSEALPVRSLLANFAKKYDRIVELGLDEISTSGIVKMSQEESGWKLSACITFLCENRLKECVACDTAMKQLALQRHLTAPYVLKIYEEIIKMGNKLTRTGVESLLSIIEVSALSLIKIIFEDFLRRFGVQCSPFKGSSFERDLTMFLNKAVASKLDRNEAVLNSDELWLSELYSLIFQNPSQVLEVFIDDAIKSSGKNDVIGVLLGYMNALCDFKTDGNNGTLFATKVRSAFARIKDNDIPVKGLFRLVRAVISKQKGLSYSVIHSLLCEALSEPQNQDNLLVSDLVHDLITEGKAQLTTQELIWTSLCLCSMLRRTPPEPFLTKLVNVLKFIVEKNPPNVGAIIQTNAPIQFASLIVKQDNPHSADNKSTLASIAEEDPGSIVTVLPHLVLHQWEEVWASKNTNSSRVSENLTAFTDAISLYLQCQSLRNRLLPDFLDFWKSHISPSFDLSSDEEKLLIVKRHVQFVNKLEPNQRKDFQPLTLKMFGDLIEKEDVSVSGKPNFLNLLFLYPDEEVKSLLAQKMMIHFN